MNSFFHFLSTLFMVELWRFYLVSTRFYPNSTRTLIYPVSTRIYPESTRLFFYPISTRNVYPASTRSQINVLFNDLEAILSQYSLKYGVSEMVNRVYYMVSLAILGFLVIFEPIIPDLLPAELAVDVLVIILGLLLFVLNLLRVLKIKMLFCFRHFLSLFQMFN